MPEYQIDLGSREAAIRYGNLDAFTRDYIEAVFWTECNEDREELADGTFADLSADALVSMIEDCADFQKSNADDLAEYETKTGYSGGVDFWLTRNGHGAGFWDRGLGELGERLTRNAKPYSSVELYRGDDGLIYC